MNRERIAALFTSIEVLIESAREATEEAKRVQIVTREGKRVAKIVNDFKVIESDTRRLESATKDAIARMEKQARYPTALAIFLMLLCSLLIGLGIGYIAFLPVKETLLEHELSQIKVERRRIQEEYGFALELKQKGFELYREGVILPQHYSDKIQTLSDGRVVIFHEMPER